jgi:hypothetical protein
LRRAVAVGVVIIAVLVGIAWVATRPAVESGDAVGGLEETVPSTPSIAPALPAPPKREPVHRDTGQPRSDDDPPDWI